MDGFAIIRHAAVAAGLAAGIGLVHGPRPAPARALQPGPAVVQPASAMRDSSDDPAVTTTMISAGRAVFRGQGGCFACHGMNLQGSAVAPPLNKKGQPWKAAKDGAFSEIVRVITKGVPSTAMLARPNGINDAAVKNVAAYIWAVNHGKAKP